MSRPLPLVPRAPLASLPSSGSAPASDSSPRHSGARHLYRSLLAEHGTGPGRIDEVTRASSRTWLAQLLESARRIDNGLPSDPLALSDWLARGHAETASAYREYLDGRRAGAPRRFFRNRSHALHFLMSVAPTKLVDGAWLYGLLARRADLRLRPLIRTYLEELGDGVSSQHHVVVYRQLLAQHGNERWRDLDDEHHMQGAIQLALAHHAADLLPEVIGFNLGYEQLPLHLPITAYELNELDIDPYYFTLHVTIDNASSGHAAKSLRCALDCLPRIGDAGEFYRRMSTGFKLNDLGLGTLQAIASFDLEQELVKVLVDKARLGAELHSDYCRIGGRTVTDWLATPGGMPAFLQALMSAGWIRRGADPSQSRFWRMLQEDGASMFGVFDGYELQLIEDWIRDAGTGDAVHTVVRQPNVNRFRRRAAANISVADAPDTASFATTSVERIVRQQLAATPLDGDADGQVLIDRLTDTGDDADAAMGVLEPFLSPANHPTPAGLLATRIYTRLFGA